ncbi:MAG TPA: replicative DNA helicase [Candidatus Baltobacteraceae bacterium]|jgi:replicative DNA helicase|nr:replicative DNA helicase [Candidatus Baltobacteraceae bacterium]
MASDTTLERPLPQNLDAERSILGAVLLDNHALNAAVQVLRSEDFFLPQHRHIFERMVQLSEKQQAIDTITLMEDLGRRGELEAAGGVAYLSQLADGLPRVTNVDHYSRIVKEKSILRGLIHSTAAIQEQAFGSGEDADVILDRAESKIFALAEDRVKAGLIGVKDLVKDGFERLEKIFSEGRRITGLATGYSNLDNETAGLQPSELIILAARPSMGKTALALNIAENVGLRQREPVAIFSLEMSKESLLLRLLASEARVDAHKFRTGHMSRDDWGKVTGALANLGEAPIWIDDSASSTVLEMGAKARRLKRDRGLSLVIVDYLQLVVPTGSGRQTNRQEEVSGMSRALKGLAKELKVPIVVLSQLTRAPEREERKPQLADLRESGAIEQDADVVLFINRPNFYKTDLPEEDRAKAELIIAKQRNGPTGTLNFVFLARHTRFEEAAPDAWNAGGEE